MKLKREQKLDFIPEQKLDFIPENEEEKLLMKTMFEMVESDLTLEDKNLSKLLLISVVMEPEPDEIFDLQLKYLETKNDLETQVNNDPDVSISGKNMIFDHKLELKKLEDKMLVAKVLEESEIDPEFFERCSKLED